MVEPKIGWDGKVAPARERGLKCSIVRVCNIDVSRSREGAWIEINIEAHKGDKNVGRSREGAWIEIELD